MVSFSTTAAPGSDPAADFPQTLKPGMPDPSSPQPDSTSDPYRGAILVLLAAAGLGSVGAVIGGMWLGSLVLLDVAITLGISTALLGGVALAQRERARPAPLKMSDPPLSPTAPVEIAAGTQTQDPTEAPAPRVRTDFNLDRRLKSAVFEIARRMRDLSGNEALIRLRISSGAAGLATLGLLLLVDPPSIPPALEVASVVAAICLIAAGLTATAVRYLGDADPTLLPEAVGLSRGARVLAWILVLAGASMGFAWVQMPSILRVLHWAMFIFNAALCSSLIEKPARAAHDGQSVPVFPLDLKLLSVLGEPARTLWRAFSMPGSSNSASICVRRGR